MKALEIHTALYAFGVQYAVPTHCRYTVGRFKTRLTNNRERSDAVNLLNCIALVYASTPDNDRALRDLVVEEVTYWADPVAYQAGNKEQLMGLMQQSERFREDMTLYLLKRCERAS